MPGQIKQMINSIVEKRARGNPTLALMVKTKLILKGMDPDRYTMITPDDPAVIAKVRKVAAELGVEI